MSQENIAGRAASTRRRVADQSFLRRNVAIIALLGVMLLSGAYFSTASDNFLTLRNFLNIVRQASPSLIVAVAMTMVITTRGIDLSVGSLTATVGGVGALLFERGWDLIPVLLAMVAVGLLAGVLNGFFVCFPGGARVHRDACRIHRVPGYCPYPDGGFSIPIGDERFLWIGQGSVSGIPVPVLDRPR